MIYRKFDTRRKTWHSQNKALCSLEVKAQYVHWVDLDSDEGRASENGLAQQVCEMFGVLCQRVDDDDDYSDLTDIDRE